MTEQELMLTSILDCRRVDLMVNPVMLTRQQEHAFTRMKARRTSGEPVQYILGECEFMGIPLSVDDRVLIPRPETEILVEQAIRCIQRMTPRTRKRILDIGTGSGNIAIALAKFASRCAITAMDTDVQALTVARRNADAVNVSQHIKFCHQDMSCFFDSTIDKKIKYDIIISNPPYIPTPQLAFLPKDVQREPKIALDGGGDGLRFYKIIIERSHRILRPGGHLLLEIGDGQRWQIDSLFRQYPQYCRSHFIKDYAGTDRIVCTQLKTK